MRNNELRDKIMELESYPEDLKDRIRDKIIHTKERPLKTWERPLWVFFCVVIGMMSLGMVIWGIMEFDTISQRPTYIIVGFAISVLLLCGIFMLLATNLKKGTVRLRNESFLIYAAFGFVLYMVIARMLSGTPVAGDDLAGLIVVVGCVICTRIESSELRLRERVLRNELALAELSELISHPGMCENAPKND